MHTKFLVGSDLQKLSVFQLGNKHEVEVEGTPKVLQPNSLFYWHLEILTTQKVQIDYRGFLYNIFILSLYKRQIQTKTLIICSFVPQEAMMKSSGPTTTN